MTARKDYVRVTVVEPSTGDGPHLYRIIRGPGSRKRRESCGHSDRARAEAEAAQLAADLNAKVDAVRPPKPRENPLLVTVLDRYLAHREADPLTAPNTLEVYRCARGAVASVLPSARAIDLSRALLEDAQRALMVRSPRPLAPSTVNLYMEKARVAWEWARGRGHPNVGPWPVDLEPLAAERTPKREWTPDELERALHEAGCYGGDGRIVPLLCLLADVGPRVGEALALRGRDVDRRAGTVTLYTPKTRRKGRRTRTVVVSPEVLEMLPRRKPDEWVFRAVTDPDKPLPYSTVQGALVTIRERAGLAGEPLDLHSFRRYAIRRVHAAGVPLKDAMDFFGHASARAHMVYMPSVATPDQQRALLARAREVHDPIAALPGRVPGRVARPADLNSSDGNGADLRGRRPVEAHETGRRGRKQARPRVGSRVDESPSTVAYPSGDPRTPALTRLLCQLAPELRALVIEVAQDEDAAAATVAVARVYWRELVRDEPTRGRAKGGRRAAR